MTQNRIQKIIAQAGIASRRKAEEMIQEGRVRINGKVITELGIKADPTVDRIEVDGKQLEGESLITILMNKPRGVVCTLHDPEGRPTVLDFIKEIDARLFPVGRLDFATSGALLLTNDGQLSFALTHPKHNVEKVYLVKIEGAVSEAQLKKWREGVDIGDGVTQPAEVFKSEQDENFTWLHVTLREGKNRQIRRMADATGLTVKKLKRISVAGLTIDGIRIGRYRVLSPLEIKKLKDQFQIPSSTVRFPKALRKAPPSTDFNDKKPADRTRTIPRAKGRTSAKKQGTAWSTTNPTQDRSRTQSRTSAKKQGTDSWSTTPPSGRSRSAKKDR